MVGSKKNNKLEYRKMSYIAPLTYRGSHWNTDGDKG
jgi:hypothetical protein